MAVLGSNSTFRDVRAWYSRLAVLDRQICRIERLDGQPLGTGFLVAADLVMTAQHVIAPSGSKPTRDFRTRFGYAVSPITGHVADGTLVEVAKGKWLLGDSPPYGESPIEAIDTALFRLAEPIGISRLDGGAHLRGWVDLNEAVEQAVEGSSLAIMQHPEGGPLKLSVNTQAVLGLDEHTGRLMYRTDTLPGSSGAPCFDLDWKFIAMHEGRDVRGGNHNLGIPFAMIRHWLDQRKLSHLVKQRSPASADIVVAEAGSGVPAGAQFAMPADLRALVAKGEGQLIEFKRGIVGVDRKAEMKRVLTSVAAFMNSRDGGNVMIGIADDRSVVGIEMEYALVDPQHENWDGYDRYLHNVLVARLDGVSQLQSFTVTRYHEQDKDVCAIHVQPANRPVFLDDQLYVRVGAQNQPIMGRKIIDFVADRWSLLGGLGKPREPQVELEWRTPPGVR